MTSHAPLNHPWPDGRRLAVTFVIHVECFDKNEGPQILPHLATRTPDIANAGWRHYGNVWGLPRLIRIFSSRGIPYSVALNSEVLSREPHVLRRLRNHPASVIAHGTTQSRPLPVNDGAEAEAAYIRETLDSIEHHLHRRPRAWLSPDFLVSHDTNAALAQEGIACTFDCTGSDVITRLDTAHGPLLQMPYALGVDDSILVLSWHFDPKAFERTLEAHVEQLADDSLKGPALSTAIGLHPSIAGQPAYARALARVLDTLRDHDDVWLTDHEVLRRYCEAVHA